MAQVKRIAGEARDCVWCDLAYGRASKQPEYTFRYYNENGVIVLTETEGGYEALFVPRRHSPKQPRARVVMTGKALLVSIMAAEALNDTRLRPQFDYDVRGEGGHWRMACLLEVYEEETV